MSGSRPTTPEYAAAIASRDALVERIFRGAIGTMEMLHIYLGDRLGLYVALDELGEATSGQLAEAAGISERYAREWLEEQAVADVLTASVDDDPCARRYRIPPGHEHVLLDEDSLSYMAPVAQALVSMAQQLPGIKEAFRSGGGLLPSAFGQDMRAGVGKLNRPLYINLLDERWLPALPDVEARLLAEPPARVADMGCGVGWSAVSIAFAYPLTRVDGFDLDPDAVLEARANAATADVADRVTFVQRDVSEPGLEGSYDLVCAFQSLHDMADPIGALETMRAVRSDGGTVLVVDGRVADTFTAPGDAVERWMYGWSALHGLPVAMTNPGAEATGAVMRPETLRRYAREAGFAGVEVLPIPHELWRFYRLVG